MKQLLERYADGIDSMPLRERALFFGAVALAYLLPVVQAVLALDPELDPAALSFDEEGRLAGREADGLPAAEVDGDGSLGVTQDHQEGRGHFFPPADCAIWTSSRMRAWTS